MMRSLGLGLAATIFLAVLAPASATFADPGYGAPPAPASDSAFAPSAAAPPVDASQRALGMKEAPPVAAAAKLPCTVTDALYVGHAAGADKINVKLYEVACKEGLGYMLYAKDKAAPTALDCIVSEASSADGKPNPFACKLPANRNFAAGLQPMVTKTGRNCTVSRARYIASSPDTNYYEAACAGGEGYVISAPKDNVGVPKALGCFANDPAGPINCTLTPRDQQAAIVDRLVAASGKPCAIKDRRYVGTTATSEDIFEFSCASGSGLMVMTDATGKFSEAIDCARAGGIAGGCTLSDAHQALASQNNIYAGLAKQAGFDCAVSKYGVFPTSDKTKEIVELACSNRPDGGVGFFPSNNAKPQVLDCLRAHAEGYRCSFSDESAVYPRLTAALKAKKRGSCVVSSARPFAVGTSKDSAGKDDYIEVGCADGGPGLVLDFYYGSQAPDEILSCGQLAKVNGGCQLPGNKKS